MEKKDLIDRKIDGLGKLWSWFTDDSIRFIAFLSIIANIILTDRLISNTEEMSNRIIEEVRRQVPMEVEEQLAPTQSKVDTVVQKLSDVINDNNDENNKDNN